MRGDSSTDNLVIDEFIPSQLILISPNKIAQYWEKFGHISMYVRVNIDEFTTVE